MLPFTREQFFGVFADYNLAVWPAQWIAYLLGAAVTLAVVLRASRYRRAVAACLAVFWIWTGVMYHALFFVTLFTFGVLLCASAPVSRWLLVIPFLWPLVGGSAAFALGVAQDWALLVSGLVVVPLILLRDVRLAQPSYAQRGA